MLGQKKTGWVTCHCTSRAPKNIHTYIHTYIHVHSTNTQTHTQSHQFFQSAYGKFKPKRSATDFPLWNIPRSTHEDIEVPENSSPSAISPARGYTSRSRAIVADKSPYFDVCKLLAYWTHTLHSLACLRSVGRNNSHHQ